MKKKKVLELVLAWNKERRKQFEIARNLLTTTLSIEERSKYTGLTLKEIEKLQN